ncbi:MAG: hypothetical protein AW09_003090 [Candidatus Accumulibacter phosphatis]|uniref:Uncharacterized protein n=1 Tax=Candidatus Accumulibacter phosphatis TaxID=327160 RepID=A0A080LTK6_9PROT|nr:MAG: hypothetical protein AW09_003090 [Candidatus Accumulibacter phosphatis]
MIEGDTGHHGTIGIVGIDRIEAPAQPDFENHDFDLTDAEDLDGGQSTKLEISQCDSASRLSRRLNPGKGLAQIGVFYRDSINAHPLLVLQEMRRGIAGHAVTGKAVDRFEIGAGRTLAVGAADSDQRALRMLTQLLLDAPDPFQPQLDSRLPARVETFEVGQPEFQREVRNRGGCRRPALLAAHAALLTAMPAASAAGSANRQRALSFPGGRRSCRSRPFRAGTRIAGNPPAGFHGRSAR